MANEIKIDLSLTGEQGTARGLKNVGDAADKAGNDLTGMAKDAEFLRTKISETEVEIKKLTKAFNDTGDMDLLKKIRKEKSNLRSLTGLLPSPAEVIKGATEVGTQAGLTVSSALSDAIRSSKGMLIPPLIGIAAAAAPAMGAAISAAVVGGLGVGGIIGGVFAAAQDQRVQDAASMIGNRVGDALTEAGSVFVLPLIESMRILEGAGDRLAANFAKIGGAIAPVMPALAKGIAGFGDQMMPGIVKAMEAARPVIRALAAELPKIGMAVGEFFDKISKDPDEAVAAMIGISQAIQGTIEMVGTLIDKLGGIYEWFIRAGAALSETWETLFGWMPIAGQAIKEQGANFRDQVTAIDAAKDASKDFANDGMGPLIRAEEDMAEATKTATQKIEDQITAMDKMFGRFMDSREVARNYQEAIDDLTESVKQHGTSLDIGTEAGRSNSEALDNLATKIKDARENTILMTGDVEGANTVYYEQVEALRQHAIKLGLSKQAANELAAGLRDIPHQVDVEIRAPGLLEALARAEKLNRLLGGISAGARARAGDDSGYGGGRAGGGPMSPGKWYTVGENGVEVVSMHADGSGATVYNSKATAAMMSGASGGSSGSAVMRPQVTITFMPSGNAAWDAVLQAIYPSLLKQIRIDGGDLTVFGAA